MPFRSLPLLALLAAGLLAGCSQSGQTTQSSSPQDPATVPERQVRIETRTDTVATIRPPAQSPAVSTQQEPADRFMVQLGAFRRPQRATEVQKIARERFALPVVNEYDARHKLYRIRVGFFHSRQEASDFRRKIRHDFPGQYNDAWIIAPGTER